MKKSSRKTPTLSKSRFMAGLQCHLRLWYQCYKTYLASPVSPAQQAIFDTGHEVGRMATRLFPGGLLIEENYLRHNKAVKSTMNAMNNPMVPSIYEAAFLHNAVRVRVDILEKSDGDRWNLIEVKSSASVKKIHLPDVAIQYYVLRGAGLNIARAGILHINNEYIYDGVQLELEKLFSFSDLTEKVILFQEEINSDLNELKRMLTKGYPPEILPSRACMSPYACEFWDHCTKEMPEFWVLNLTGINREKLHELESRNIHDIRSIPDTFTLSPLQERIKTCVTMGKAYLSPELRPELTDVDYPIHFLDFETVGPAIPRYPHTRPYQPIPFQWSDHILHGNGSLDHSEFLYNGKEDPRKNFASTLLDTLGNQGTIFTYTPYENRVITELAEHLPQLREQLLSVLNRFKDLQELTKKYFYHPQFQGSFSLKSVLPALVPSMNYENLAIHEGEQASREYLRMIDPATPDEERGKIQNALLAYCGQDTIAMLKIREELLKRF